MKFKVIRPSSEFISGNTLYFIFKIDQKIEAFNILDIFESLTNEELIDLRNQIKYYLNRNYGLANKSLGELKWNLY